MKFIGIGHISIFHLNPVLASVFYLIRSYSQLELSYNDPWKQNHPIFLTLIMFLAESVVGIFTIIDKIRNKKRKERRLTEHKKKKAVLVASTTSVPATVLFDKKPKPSKAYRSLIIAAIASLEFSGFFGLQYVTKYYQGSSDLQIQIRTFKLVFDSLFCYQLLKMKVYRQHYLSIVMLIIGVILVTCQEAFSENFEVILILIFLVHSLILSIRDCLEKYLIEKQFMNAVTLLFIRGVIGSILSFCLGIIFYFASDSLNIFKSFAMIFNSNAASIIWFIVYFLCSIFYNFFYSLIKQYFSPTHMGVSDAFSTVMWMIILQVIPSYEKDVKWALLIIGYILVVFGCFVYNDIVILYFCKLDHNTKYEVAERSAKELTSAELMSMHSMSLYEDNIISQSVYCDRE